MNYLNDLLIEPLEFEINMIYNEKNSDDKLTPTSSDKFRPFLFNMTIPKFINAQNEYPNDFCRFMKKFMIW